MDIFMFFQFFASVKNALSGAVSVFIIIAGLAGMGLIIYVALKIPVKPISVCVTALGIFTLSIPVITSFNVLVDKQAVNNLSREYQALLERKKVEIDLLEQKELNAKQEVINTRQGIHIDSLESELRLLKNTQLQINDYTKILEVNLLETPLKQTAAYRKMLKPLEAVWTTEGMLFWKEDVVNHYTYDEAIVILTHDIVAKFGIDIKNIRISNSKTTPNTIEITGIESKFSGTSKNSYHKELAEIRTVYVNAEEVAGKNISDEELLSKDFSHRYIWVDTSRDAEANRYADTCIAEYNERLQMGLETQFMNEAVKKLAQEFLKLMLAPLNKNIVFVDEISPESLNITDYFEAELKTVENKNKANTQAIKELDEKIKKEANAQMLVKEKE